MQRRAMVMQESRDRRWHELQETHEKNWGAEAMGEGNGERGGYGEEDDGRGGGGRDATPHAYLRDHEESDGFGPRSGSEPAYAERSNSGPGGGGGGSGSGGGGGPSSPLSNFMQQVPSGAGRPQSSSSSNGGGGGGGRSGGRGRGRNAKAAPGGEAPADPSRFDGCGDDESTQLALESLVQQDLQRMMLGSFAFPQVEAALHDLWQETRDRTIASFEASGGMTAATGVAGVLDKAGHSAQLSGPGVAESWDAAEGGSIQRKATAQSTSRRRVSWDRFDHEQPFNFTEPVSALTTTMPVEKVQLEQSPLSQV